ncbi:G/U mismatch-specific uracil-DNA glycosylase [Methylophilus rhizosphaerae]|uniref:G/U mismatch-specific uracil-DNA glycosylase n=1 Tax=Methylophilus rhizosphaerae TaxID=492660 RepID=A0A1G9BIP7_9PROT|nr:DNA-deoxyinosine glycosylase [Methylophilus rhizosphaerae]SDK39341.1 G/U mismatch-specific uracil-DNA glycosylase [Methylophilus rhizosphaerae]
MMKDAGPFQSLPDLLLPSLPHAFGFPPIAGGEPDILILGSLPGIASIRQQQYYAHPQNSFWRMMQALFGIEALAPYFDRCEQVKAAGLAIWDVCHSAHRPGSLDSAITPHTVVANDINGLLAAYPSIQVIGLNGSAAAKLFKKHIRLERAVHTLALPSTSPAHAAMPYAKKLERWSALLNSMNDAA